MAKKILCFIDCLSSGGAQRQMVGLAHLLKKSGYRVRLASYYDIPFYNSYLEEHGVDYEYLAKANNKWRRIFEVYKYIKAYSPNVVIAYLNGPSTMACICKMLGAGKFKLIVSERNTTQCLTWGERIKFWSYRFADKIVSNSYSQDKFIRAQYPFLSPKCEVITNYVDLERFGVSVTKNASNGNELKIVGVGRVSEQKNILNFIDAVQLVKQRGIAIKVSWYGRKEGDYYDRCVDKIKEYGLDREFVFHTPVQDIETVYGVVDLFCLPSIYEGFPNVLCEAMSCGIPVACSRVCDNPYIVEDGKTGLMFDPNDVCDIASQIERFANLPRNQWVELGKNARLWAEAHLSKEQFIEKYIGIIES